MYWLSANYKWLFDGVGAAALLAFVGYLLSRVRDSRRRRSPEGPDAITNSPVANGNNISQAINSPTLNLSLPTPTGAPGRERYEEWRELIDEIRESIDQMYYAFVPVLAHGAGDERFDYQAGIRRGNRSIGSRIVIGGVVDRLGLKEDWDGLVHYVRSRVGPHDSAQQEPATMGGFESRALAFQKRLVEAAREDMDGSQLKVHTVTNAPEGQSPAWPQKMGEYIASSSEAIPLFPERLSGYRSEDGRDFWNKAVPIRGVIRLFGGDEWQGLPKFPKTMNGCSAGRFMIRWRSASPHVVVRCSVRSSESRGNEKAGIFGYMFGNNCEQPMFKIAESRNGATLVDVYYELKFWQAAP